MEDKKYSVIEKSLDSDFEEQNMSEYKENKQYDSSIMASKYNKLSHKDISRRIEEQTMRNYHKGLKKTAKNFKFRKTK